MRRALLVLPALLLLLTACLPIEEEAPPPPVITAAGSIDIKTVVVSRGDVLLHRYCTVISAPAKEEDLSFSLNDLIIAGVYVQEGDLVREGDILAELDHGYYLDEIVSAERDEALTRLYIRQLEERYALDRSYSWAAGFQADEAYYTGQRSSLLTQLEILILRKERLQNEESRRVLRSPMDGIVTYVMPNPAGERTVADQCVVTVADKSKQVFVLRGADSELVNAGDLLELSASGATFTGRIAEPEELGISRSVGEREKYVVLTDDSIIIEQDNVTAHIIIERANNTIYVPKNVVKRVGERAYVYVLDNEVRTIRDVEIGLEGSSETEILSGLDVGEIVIVA